MFHPPPSSALSIITAIAVGTLAFVADRSNHQSVDRLDGFNVIVSPGHPFGSPSAKLALTKAKHVGADAIAVVPFLWQANPNSPGLTRGNDMTDDELRAAVRDGHARGLRVIIKPHVWVPERWAGTVVMNSEPDWQQWFGHYDREMRHIAQIAAAEKADALVIGTELDKTIQRPEWNKLIGDLRGIYAGPLLYVAHDIDDMEKVPFWSKLDDIGVSLYPPLGAGSDRSGRRMVMQFVADRLDEIARRTGKPIIVAEIGLRSAQGATARPWESPEERTAAPDPALQAEVLSDWLAVLDRPAIHGILIWRWFTDPDAGGMTDTDFTVQGKAVERVLTCAWTKNCAKDDPKVAWR